MMANVGSHCQFYLEKKKRFCRFAPKKNAAYCPEHACVMGIQEDRKRLPCPLNPNHNCYEDELQKHLKKCNVTKNRQAIEKLPYFVKDINKGHEYDCKNKVASTMSSVRDLTSDKLGAIILKVNKLYTDVVDSIEKKYLEHSRIKEDIVGSPNLDLTKSFGDQAVLRKEMLQQASLVGQLENQGLLSRGCHYVELGAGKGKLSHWICKASEEHQDNSFLLVERSSVRYKVDPYHKGEKANQKNFQRIKIDIQDLCLGKVPGMQSKESVVVVGKHLCGGATDLGIRCAVDSLNPLCEVSSESASHQQSPSEKNIAHGLPTETSHVKIIDPKQHSDKEVSSSVYPSNDSGVNIVKQCDLDKEPPNKVPRMKEEDFSRSKLQGIMIALCCHHRCTWDTYVGQEFMRRHEINEGEFDLLTRLSSWATCARTRVRGKTTNKKATVDQQVANANEDEGKPSTALEAPVNDDNKPTGKEVEEEEDHSVDDLIGAEMEDNISLREKLSVTERETIGRKAKRIIDMGRIEYLESKKLNCCLREYISDSITPENVVLIATSQNSILPK